MSYDLYFLVPDERDPVSIEEFGAYFAGRSRYRLDGAQAIYRNENTGVQFAFDYVDPEGDSHDMTGVEDEEEQPEARHADGWRSAHVLVSVNYLRPQVFGFEAVPEIEAFIDAFDLSVDDPQSEGMGRGSFTAESFQRGWEEGNRFAYHAAVEQLLETKAGDPQALPALPAAEIERCWQWNHAAESLQESLGEAVSVPTIRFLRNPDGVRSFVVWTDAATTAIPKTDLVVLVRDALAPRAGLLRRKKNVVSILPHAAVLHAQDASRWVSEHVEPYHLFHDAETRESVLGLFESAPPISDEPQGVSAEAILIRELLQEAIEAAAGTE